MHSHIGLLRSFLSLLSNDKTFLKNQTLLCAGINEAYEALTHNLFFFCLPYYL